MNSSDGSVWLDSEREVNQFIVIGLLFPIIQRLE